MSPIVHCIIWLLGMLCTGFLVFVVVGHRNLARMCPEFDRPWLLPAQLVSMALFAGVSAWHPF